MSGHEVRIFPSISRSQDTAVVPLTRTLEADSEFAVVGTNGVTDLAGNPLADFTSRFTSAALFDVGRPSIVAVRPGNGATRVAAGLLVLNWYPR